MCDHIGIVSQNDGIYISSDFKGISDGDNIAWPQSFMEPMFDTNYGK